MEVNWWRFWYVPEACLAFCFAPLSLLVDLEDPAGLLMVYAELQLLKHGGVHAHQRFRVVQVNEPLVPKKHM